MKKEAKKQTYKRYHDYHLRADRNTFSWAALKKKAKEKGNSLNEQINEYIKDGLIRDK